MDTADMDLTITGPGDFRQRGIDDATPRWLVNGSGDLTIDAGTFEIQSSTVTTLLLNVVSGRTIDINTGISSTVAGIRKQNTGLLLLDGVNLYSGDTLVSAGILGGNGSSLLSELTVNPGATIAPGNSIGSIGFDAADVNGIWEVEISGSSIDLLNIDNLLDIADATIDFDELTAISGSGLIFGTYGTLSGEGSVTLTNVPEGYFVDYAFNGNNLALVGFAPEPSSIVLAALSLFGLTFAGRRRRKRA